mmetsp:Transcript_32659/g.85821  ORF Transcript_32659/g.85821 Transcript_32659/m.85821 type:complete len:213 (-) Transcript_32659:1476-2114(-)
MHTRSAIPHVHHCSHHSVPTAYRQANSAGRMLVACTSLYEGMSQLPRARPSRRPPRSPGRLARLGCLASWQIDSTDGARRRGAHCADSRSSRLWLGGRPRIGRVSAACAACACACRARAVRMPCRPRAVRVPSAGRPQAVRVPSASTRRPHLCPCPRPAPRVGRAAYRCGGRVCPVAPRRGAHLASSLHAGTVASMQTSCSGTPNLTKSLNE